VSILILGAMKKLHVILLHVPKRFADGEKILEILETVCVLADPASHLAPVIIVWGTLYPKQQVIV
jgi:hypothetical protein